MNVMATTFPRRSLSESRASSWVVSVNSGAGPIFARRGSPLTSSPATRAAAAHTARATSAAVQSLGRLTLALQLLLQLGEEPPVGALSDDLLGARLDQARLVKPERVEAHRVLGIELAPAGVGHLLERLKNVVGALREPSVDDGASDSLGLQGAHVNRLQDRTQRPLGRHRLLPDELPVPECDAAEVLGPRAVHHHVDHDVTNLLRPCLQRYRKNR